MSDVLKSPTLNGFSPTGSASSPRATPIYLRHTTTNLHTQKKNWGPSPLSSFYINAENVDLPLLHVDLKQAPPHSYLRPRTKWEDRSIAAHFRALDLWNKIVVVLFVACFIMLVGALAGFGHVEKSCEICSMGKDIRFRAETFGEYSERPYEEDSKLQGTLHDHTEVSITDYEEKQQDKNQHYDPELSFFLKHFNERFDFVPLDAVDEVRRKQWRRE